MGIFDKLKEKGRGVITSAKPDDGVPPQPAAAVVERLRAISGKGIQTEADGDEIVVTDRGVPVARMLGLQATSALEQLTQQGVIARPGRPGRPSATGRTRPRSRRPLADIVSEQRG